mgnify:FL=1
MGENIKKWMAYFRKRDIRFVISICFTLVAVCGSAFIGMSLFFRFSAANEAALEENNKRIVNQVNMSLDGYLRNLMKVSDTMRYRVLRDRDIVEDSFNSDMNLLYEANRESIVSIAVFDKEGELIDATPLAKLKKTAEPKKESWFYEAQTKIENIHFSTPHVQNLFEDVEYKYKWVVSLSRSIELMKGGKTETGVLLVDMNFSGIEQIFKNIDLGKSGYVYLMNDDGEMIYHPRQQLIYSNLEKESSRQAAAYEDGSHVERFEGQKRLVTVKTVGYTGWKIVGVSPMVESLQNNFQIRMFVLILFLFTIFLLLLANTFVSAKIADPIMELEKSVRELEQGHLDAPIAIGGSYEIRHLGEAIQSMAEQMQKLMDDIVTEQESKRKSEFDALQSQINPHFLYNTLDSIVWMVENERYQEAIVMVTSLAGFFRVGLSKGKNIIPLEDELNHAGNYITIQHMRFRDKFTFHINVEKGLLHMATIKLIIQPLLENAVYHGVEFMDGDGEIEVNAYSKDGGLYIDVVDNGMGIPEEEIAGLLKRDATHRGKGSGIGLRNVHERIQLYFGEAYGQTILSEADVGTTVRIHLPLVSYESAEQWGGEKS